MLGQVVACQMAAALFCHFLALPRIAQGIADHPPQTFHVTKTQDVGSIRKIMRNEQRTAGTQVNCITRRIFPEAEGVVTGTWQRQKYPAAL